MSGGSYDYAYSKVDDMADSLLSDKNPLRRAFAKHLKLVAAAMHDIEWVDSADYGTGDDVEAIEKALGKDAKSLMLLELIADAKIVNEALSNQIQKLEDKLNERD